jgi:hypothetical protein
VSPTPLALVLGLTAGDYLLWNWSLNGSYDIPALVSGLTLPPLAAASILLLATAVLRLLARSTHRLGTAQTSRAAEPELTVHRANRPIDARDAPAYAVDDREWAATTSEEEGQRAAATGTRRRPSRKLAA